MGRILGIDVDFEVLSPLSQALMHVGHEVEVACDRDEGIELIGSDR